MPARSNAYDAVVLGAGAAGMMCAAIAGARGRRVRLLEHADKPGKKILISGGGRCNFTNTDTAPDRFISENPHFAKSALRRYSPSDFIALVDRYNIAWHEKTLGQLFCDGSARQIVDMLLSECANGGVTIELATEIRGINHADGLFTITTNGETARAPALVIATGGPSIPKMGATGFAYEVAKQFGLKVQAPRPALVPFTLSGDEHAFTQLAGVSANVVARCGKVAFCEAALFTHRGLSGPAILQISSYWSEGRKIILNFLPAHDADWLIDTKREIPRANLQAALASALPDRLAKMLADNLATRLPVTSELANTPDKILQSASHHLTHWGFTPSGTEGFAKAEVTAGGICTSGLSSKTMEAKSVPGLYAIGEAVDVTGWLGGYNFQWAWASAVAAGRAI